MKYGILGDIHSNLSALETVLECMAEHAVDQILSVGDVVGYGAAPSECIAVVRERGTIVVMGNHDAAVVGALDDMHFNPYARAAVAWTRQEITGDEAEWLRSLPMTATLDHCQVSHGTLHKPELFDYVLSLTDADPSLDDMQRPVCFVGHTHIPLIVMRFADEPNRTAYTFDPQLDLSETTRALVNVGSVGQPRDENPQAAYAIYDSDTRFIEILRTDYDIEKEGARILAAGLPQVLADRLQMGV